MNQRRITHHCLALVLATLLTFVSGCNLAVATNIATFALGFATASRLTSTTVEFRCFRDGVEVPCGGVPPMLGQ